MRPKFIVVILCFLWAVAAQATRYNNGITTDSLVKTIKIKALAGDKMSFRDLGYLLDDTSQHNKLLSILDDISFFPSKIIDFKQNVTKVALLDFFYFLKIGNYIQY